MSTNIENFYESQITRNWTATTGDFNVGIAPTISEGIIVISPSSRTLREIVRYTATGTNAYGPFVTVSNVAHRGLGGTTAQSHTIGEKIRMNITAEHWTEMQDDIDSIVAAGLPAGTEGDIITYTGGNWVAQQPIIKFGYSTKNLQDASTTQTIVHGLGKIPKLVKLIATFQGGVGSIMRSSYGLYDGISHTCTNAYSNSYTHVVSTTYTIALGSNGSPASTTGQTGVVTFDATNITITWTKAGTPNAESLSFIWEAQ